MMVRVVVDTNVLVSALISKTLSTPLKVYNLLKSENLLLVTSPVILEELEEVLHREEIVILHKLNQKQIQKILEEIVETSVVVPGTLSNKYPIVKADPDDDKFIAAAQEAHADYIVSGDKHLLNLKEYRGVKIVSPADFVRILEK